MLYFLYTSNDKERLIIWLTDLQSTPLSKLKII